MKISHFSPSSRRRGSRDAYVWSVRDQRSRTILRCYRQMRRAGMNPFAARGVIVDLLSAGMFDAKLRYAKPPAGSPVDLPAPKAA